MAQVLPSVGSYGDSGPGTNQAGRERKRGYAVRVTGVDAKRRASLLPLPTPLVGKLEETFSEELVSS